MSTRQTGNRYENELCRMAEELGYCTFPARGSRGPIDVLCFEAQAAAALSSYEKRLMDYGGPPLVVQVGTGNKPIASTLVELEKASRPIGSLCIVARRVRQKNRRITWRFHTRSGTFDSLALAIDCREAA